MVDCFVSKDKARPQLHHAIVRDGALVAMSSYVLVEIANYGNQDGKFFGENFVPMAVGDFPDYKQVIPKTPVQACLSVDFTLLKKITVKQGAQVYLNSIDGRGVISFNKTDRTLISFDLFSFQFLKYSELDLNHIELEIREHNSPITIKNKDMTVIVMSMRIK